MNVGLNKFFDGKDIGRFFEYDDFIEYSESKINNSDENRLSDLEKKYLDYSKINLQRTKRIGKSYKPKQELIDLVSKTTKPQFWIIITEDWCGDSAQNLPYLMKYLKQNENIDVKVILRDENLEAVDNYFNSSNTRSIPRIIGFDNAGNELFVWGPRPKFAQDLVSQLKSEGYSREEFNKELHLWYGRNRGKELEKELTILFSQIVKK